MLPGIEAVTICPELPALKPTVSRYSMRWPMCSEWVTKPPWYKATLKLVAFWGQLKLITRSDCADNSSFESRTSVGRELALSPDRYGGVYFSTRNSVTNGSAWEASRTDITAGLDPAIITVPSSKSSATE